MPNPKGNPESLQPFTTDRAEPLIAKLTLRVPQSMMDKIKSIENYPEFCRQALKEALDKFDQSDDEQQ
ncbi:hypothetical protein [Dendronalium sp. ChiSLP03b]|uniref:hypothetical protein n=1 Tax=Dendronalium sp. ChiSLP03b TaxID=3075381 RepID=UPI002AD21F1D|nr:hypothetical protein [Dendronalium sp. ChiSLP03b]MDZ8205134.1 hypothetical protein [Dendronalium sp. ChiSLP03b]